MTTLFDPVINVASCAVCGDRPTVRVVHTLNVEQEEAISIETLCHDGDQDHVFVTREQFRDANFIFTPFRDEARFRGGLQRPKLKFFPTGGDDPVGPSPQNQRAARDAGLAFRGLVSDGIVDPVPLDHVNITVGSGGDPLTTSLPSLAAFIRPSIALCGRCPGRPVTLLSVAEILAGTVSLRKIRVTVACHGEEESYDFRADDFDSPTYRPVYLPFVKKPKSRKGGRRIVL